MAAMLILLTGGTGDDWQEYDNQSVIYNNIEYFCNTYEDDITPVEIKQPTPDPWRRKDKKHFPKWRR